MKVFIYPTNSLILADLVERFGHKPLMINNAIGEKVRNAEIDHPPMNITDEDPKKGLKYAAIEVPSGVRGRMSMIGPLIDEAEAAIIMNKAPMGFGCVGCERTNELTKYLVRRSEVPILNLEYPESEEDAKVIVKKIALFLEGLEDKK
ncbi:putative methanogenesis marker protein 5 [Methanococcus voltae]|uniref:methanogenesis marker 5 protein n=1 Tax=Methanococcus voltae TaxID=2188 RepID=UPI001AE13BC1|nr:methanogenesis marker 5 protein [Methanococcus voltae]MBP2143191.1 putative methanogenesis marker protein 5 [Methanococcus voltae]